MERTRSIHELPTDVRLVAAIGVLDGVHRGHCALLDALRRTAAEENARSVIVTLDPHPQAVFTGTAPPLLCDLDERVARLERVGVDIVVVQHFDRALSELSADEFLKRLGAGRNLAAIVMGEGSAIGHGRAGTPDRLRESGRRDGYRVVSVQPFLIGGAPVNSSRIRGLIASGRLADARRLLGRSHAVRGEVVHGDGRGRQLGFPTANLRFEQPVALPPNGIYAVHVSWGGPDPLQPARRNPGVASLGVRPTFGVGERVLEVHLLDFDEDLYGEQLRVTFIRRQRDERRFADVQALVKQMELDRGRAREILERSAASASIEAPC